MSEVPDLINLHNSWNFRHVPEVLERMPEGMPKMLEWILEARSEAGSAGSNYFWVLRHSRHFRHSRWDFHPLGGWVVYGAAVTERSRGHPNIMQHIHISLILEIALCSPLAAFLSGQAFWGQKKLAFWHDPPAPKCRQQTLRMCLIIFQINSTRCVW